MARRLSSSPPLESATQNSGRDASNRLPQIGSKNARLDHDGKPPLPSDVANSLHRAQQLEYLAGDDERRRPAAIRGTTALLLAIRAAGWDWERILSEVDFSYNAARGRCLIYRKEHGSREVRGLDITPAPPRRANPPQLPLEQRDWLSHSEFVQLAGITFGTVSFWRRAGLLPATVKRPGRTSRYSRRDLDRIRSAPRRGKVGVDYRAVLAMIEQERLGGGCRTTQAVVNLVGGTNSGGTN